MKLSHGLKVAFHPLIVSSIKQRNSLVELLGRERLVPCIAAEYPISYLAFNGGPITLVVPHRRHDKQHPRTREELDLRSVSIRNLQSYWTTHPLECVASHLVRPPKERHGDRTARSLSDSSSLEVPTFFEPRYPLMRA
jgi:hypothetical protein